MYTTNQIIGMINDVQTKLALNKAWRHSQSDLLRKAHTVPNTRGYTPQPTAARIELEKFVESILDAHRAGPQRESLSKRGDFSSYTPVTRDQDRVAKAIHDGHHKGGAQDLSKLFVGDNTQQSLLAKSQRHNASLVKAQSTKHMATRLERRTGLSSRLLWIRGMTRRLVIPAAQDRPRATI